MVNRSADLREGEEAERWRIWLDRIPEEEEIIEQMKLMRDAAPCEDGVCLSYLLNGGRKVLDEVIQMVGFMFENGAEMWEDTLKIGMVVPLYKGKGCRDDANNYRGVCLLSLGSRIVARICAKILAGMAWMASAMIVPRNRASLLFLPK